MVRAILIAVGLGVVAIGAWAVFVRPTAQVRNRAVAAVCDDAGALLATRLLDEAETAYREIARHVSPANVQAAKRPGCLDAYKEVIALRSAAAFGREQGDQYLGAAALKRKTKGTAAALRAEQAHVVAIRRARSGYMHALKNDPFAPEPHASLRAALGLLGVPADTDADTRCDLARDLVGARLYQEAAVLYGQALRTGRTTRCVASQLVEARKQRANATRLYGYGAQWQARENDEIARLSYLAALTFDPSLKAARTALATTDAPSARGGTAGEQLGDDILAPFWSWIGGAVAWVAANTNELLAALALAIALMLLFRFALLAITHGNRGRKLVGFVHTPRFTTPQPRVAPFAPEEVGGTTSTVVAHWMSEPLVDPQAGMELALDSSAPLDCWTEPSVADDLNTALTGINPIAGQLVTAARRLSPSRALTFTGYVLDRCEHGPGVRVTERSHFGKLRAARLWWATDLPGPPLTAESDESEARHALAIHAATWARYRVP